MECSTCQDIEHVETRKNRQITDVGFFFIDGLGNNTSKFSFMSNVYKIEQQIELLGFMADFIYFLGRIATAVFG